MYLILNILAHSFNTLDSPLYVKIQLNSPLLEACSVLDAHLQFSLQYPKSLLILSTLESLLGHGPKS